VILEYLASIPTILRRLLWRRCFSIYRETHVSLSFRMDLIPMHGLEEGLLRCSFENYLGSCVHLVKWLGD
jgi:hypothetical protein